MKPIRFGFQLTLVLLLAVACTPITPPPPPPTRTPTSLPGVPPTSTLLPLPTATPTPVAVRLVLLETLPPDQADALNADVAAFEAIEPNYTIEVRHYDDPHDVLSEALTGEVTEFHLVLGNASTASVLQAQGLLQALDEQFDPEFLENFASPALTGVTRDGHLWGLPDTAGFHLLLFYNRDLIAVPPSNTEALYAVAESFTSGDHWGLVLNSYDPVWVVPWLWAYGGWLTDGDGNPTLDIPPMVNALTLYLSWHGRLTGVAPVTTYVEARDLFVGGQSAMLIDGEWAIGELSRVHGLDWGVAPLPVIGETGQPAAPLVAGRYWLVSKEQSAAERKAAIDFLSFVTAPDRQLDWMAQFELLPTRREALEDPAILDDPLWRVSAQQMQAGRGLLLGVDANQLFDAMRGPLRAVLDGDMVPVEAARAMQANLE